jgi:hypothetical protein
MATCQLTVLFWTLTSVTFKSRSNKNLGIMSSIIIRCTDDKNLEMIQPLWGVIAKNQIKLKFGVWGQWHRKGYICTKFQVNSPSGYKMCAVIDPDKLWPLWPWKVKTRVLWPWKVKTRVLCHVSLLDVPMIKSWRLSSHSFRSHSTFFVFGFGPLVAKPRIRSDRNLVCTLISPRVHMCTVSGQ